MFKKSLKIKLYFKYEIFYQLSQICHNIQSRFIIVKEIISNRLTDLISIQKNLKDFSMLQDYNQICILPSLITKLLNTLIKLSLYGFKCILLSFIAKFTSLQELELSFHYDDDFEGFEKLKCATFPQLQILKI